MKKSLDDITNPSAPSVWKEIQVSSLVNRLRLVLNVECKYAFCIFFQVLFARAVIGEFLSGVK